jgi:hypothetical protein
VFHLRAADHASSVVNPVVESGKHRLLPCTTNGWQKNTMRGSTPPPRDRTARLPSGPCSEYVSDTTLLLQGMQKKRATYSGSALRGNKEGSEVGLPNCLHLEFKDLNHLLQHLKEWPLSAIPKEYRLFSKRAG